MKQFFTLFAIIFVSIQSHADGIFEGFETGIQDPYNGNSTLTWIGDVGDFEITNSTWASGETCDFSGSHSLRAQSGQILNSTILVDISSTYSSNKKIRWEVYIGGNSADLTSSYKGVALILFVNSNTVSTIESGAVNGYRLRLCDPSLSGGWVDGLYFEKADGEGWSMIDSLHTGDANINQGWNIVVEREPNGNWNWGYSNGSIGTSVSLSKSTAESTYTSGTYAGLYWNMSSTKAHYVGFDNFKVDPYTPNLWKSEAGSTNWSTASNWDDGIVPSTLSNIQIEAGTNQPIIEDNTSCGNLTLEGGANLTISPEIVLSVNGNFTLQSDTDGTASIIDHGTLNIVGNSSIQKYMKCYDPSAYDEYHFLSIPIANHAAENSFQSYYVYPFDETQNTWTALSSGDEVLKGEGYSVYYAGEANHCIEFSGTPNTGDQIISITASNYSGTSSNDNWNLIGNPFPSPIDWDEVTKNNIESAIYIWNAETCTYASYVNGVGTNFNNDGIIPAMQGFFVHATATGNLTIPQTARVHNQTQDYLMKNDESDSQLKIRIKNDNYSDECVIRFKNEATDLWDDTYDALKFLSGKEEVPQIFTLINQEIQASINTLPEQMDQYEIPLVCRVEVGGTYEICVSEVSTLIKEYDIVLADKMSGEHHEIVKDSCYQLTLIAGEVEHFTLFMNRKKTNIQEKQNKNIGFNICSDGKIEIDNISTRFMGGEIRLISLDGKTVFSKLIDNPHMEFYTDQHGIFILQFRSKQNILTKKIIIV